MSSTLVTRPNATLAVDILGLVVSSFRGNLKYLFVCVDVFSKLIKLYPLRKISAQSVSKCLLHLFCTVGFYKNVISDRHSIFNNSLWSATLKLLKAKEVHTVCYRPAGNPCEASVKKAKCLLSMYSGDHRSWPDFLVQMEWALNQKVSQLTGFSPNMLHFGRELPGTFDTGRIDEGEEEVFLSYPDYVEKMKISLNSALETAGKIQFREKEKQKKRYDKGRRAHTFKIGDLVYLKAVNLSSAIKHQVAGLKPKFKGPYRIVKKFNSNNFEIDHCETKLRYKVNCDQLRHAFPRPDFVSCNKDFTSDYRRRRPSDDPGKPLQKYDFRERR